MQHELSYLTKIFANRFKGYLNNPISKEQSIFIFGCSIHNNNIVAPEMVHFTYHDKAKNLYIMIKIDIEKTFNKLSW